MSARGVFVGLSTIDVLYGVDHFPVPNSKVAANDQKLFIGGPATNAAITFSLLGGKSSLVTVAGRHTIAEVIRKELREYSIRLVDLDPDFQEVPVISSVSIDKAGNRNVVSANTGRIPVPPGEVDLKVLHRARIVLVDGHYMERCQAWSRAAKSLGISVVLDAGSWKDGTEELLRSVDTVICSSDFLPPGCRKQSDVFDYLKARGAENIAMTRGSDPVLFSSRSSSGSLRVPQVKAIDTLGAGDVLHGAFCYYVSIRRKFDAALGEAVRIAADSCRFRGPRAWADSLVKSPVQSRKN